MNLIKIWNKIWRDKRGRVVIWQSPNVLLLAWLILTIVSLLMSGQKANTIQVLGNISLMLWAILEIVKGVNYFRRGLGLLILILSIISIFHIG
ncbi:MAG TPA: hypothetical protein VLF63_01130 [Patescibacteria group bacterium]|nr:hypothetical protein [Patescibacteria group bacterium]